MFTAVQLVGGLLLVAAAIWAGDAIGTSINAALKDDSSH